MGESAATRGRESWRFGEQVKGLRRYSLLPLLLAGCTIHVTPPAPVSEPSSVYIADYGRHSSLILPRGGGGLVEYAYGEWEWFAEGHDECVRVVPVLFWPTPGTLGHRELPHHDASAPLRIALCAERLLTLQVEARRCRELLRRLDERFAAGAARRSLYNILAAMEFVPDPDPYCICSDCNTKVADWLRELGCEVRGGGFAADFELHPPPSRE